MQQHNHTHMQMQEQHTRAQASRLLAVMCWQHGGHACSQHATTGWHVSSMAPSTLSRDVCWEAGPSVCPPGMLNCQRPPLSLRHTTTLHNNTPQTHQGTSPPDVDVIGRRWVWQHTGSLLVHLLTLLVSVTLSLGDRLVCVDLPCRMTRCPAQKQPALGFCAVVPCLLRQPGRGQGCILPRWGPQKASNP
jgi:hypothetical protein